MNPKEKTRRRRNPEGEDRRTPWVSFTEGRCPEYPVTNADTLEAARGEISELRKGLQATLQQLDEYEANGGQKSPYIFPEVSGILNHVKEPSHTHHPKNDATFLEWERNTDDAGRNCKLRRRLEDLPEWTLEKS